MSTILITGGTGFVGGRIARRLANTHNVIVSSRKKPAQAILEAHGVTESVLHASLLEKETFPTGIDTVIQMAALNEWDCVKYPSEAIRVNINETRILLEQAIAAGVKQFIYFSTAHVYGNPLKGLITEDTLPVPQHPYAITHKAAEDYVVAAGLQNKISSIVIRLSNSFGAPVVPDVNRWTLLANDLCRQAIEKGKMVLLSNGCQYRDFVCLSDVENCIDVLVSTPRRDEKIIYNLGAGVAMKVIDMAHLIATVHNALFGKAVAVELPPGIAPTTEPSLEYSVQRLKARGLSMKNDFEQEIKGLLLFCADHFGTNIKHDR
jgi:UDP-glucose 4-epimerase